VDYAKGQLKTPFTVVAVALPGLLPVEIIVFLQVYLLLTKLQFSF